MSARNLSAWDLSRALIATAMILTLAPPALAQPGTPQLDDVQPVTPPDGEVVPEVVSDPPEVKPPPVEPLEQPDEAAGSQTTPPAGAEDAAALKRPQDAPRATPAAPLFSEAELVAAARANASVMDAEAARKRNAQWQLYRAKYAWAPKLQADSLLAPVPANTDVNDFGNNLSTITALNVGPYFKQTASLVLPLYTFGRINRAKALAEIGVENAGLEGRKAELELMFQVRRAYYGLQLARALDGMIKEGEGLVFDQLEKMEEARNFGEADFETKDFRKLQIFASEFETRVLDNQKLVTLGLAGMEYLTEQDVLLENIPALPMDEEPEPLEGLEYYRKLARKHRPEMLQLRAATRARDEELGLRRAEFFPNIFLAMNFSYGVSTEVIARTQVQREVDGEFVDTDLSSPPFSNPYNQLGLGVAVGMRWNFDFVQLYGKYRETEASVVRTQAQKLQAFGAIDLELQKLHLEAEQARKKIEIQSRRLEAARRWRDSLGISAELTGQGLESAKISDAIDPLKAYYEAKLLHMQAIVEYKIARAALAQGVGLDDLSMSRGERLDAQEAAAP